jgi:diacylglycerol kinase family enzyme
MQHGNRHVFVILNAAAAGFLHRPVRDICDRITSICAAHGITAEIQLIFGGSIERRARDAIASGTGAVIAGGGDGTVGSVAAALADSKIPLGVLPLGRFGHFARDLGIPHDLEQALEVIARGHIATVDLGEVNGRIFVNNSSLGAYPFLVLDRERRRGRRLQRPLALLFATVKLLRLFPLRRVSVRAAERAEIWRTPCLFVGNNQYQLELFALGRRPRLNAGELWIYIARQQTRLSLVWFTLKCLTGLTDPAKDLRLFHVASAEIGAHSRHLTVAMDGEVIRMRTPLKYRIRPAALRVYVPVPPEEVSDARDRTYFGPSLRKP